MYEYVICALCTSPTISFLRYMCTVRSLEQSAYSRLVQLRCLGLLGLGATSRALLYEYARLRSSSTRAAPSAMTKTSFFSFASV